VLDCLLLRGIGLLTKLLSPFEYAEPLEKRTLRDRPMCNGPSYLRSLCKAGKIDMRRQISFAWISQRIGEAMTFYGLQCRPELK
jgi:hypothetical protein